MLVKLKSCLTFLLAEKGTLICERERNLDKILMKIGVICSKISCKYKSYVLLNSYIVI